MRILRTLAIILFDLIDIYIHQKKILKVLKKNLENIKVLIDVGAYKGTYTDLIINNFNTKKVLMFEPHSSTYSFLKKKYKNKNNFLIFNKAVSNKKSTLMFNFNKHDLTSSLSKLDVNNNYLKIKAKLFGTTSAGMIIKKKKLKTTTLLSTLNNKKIKFIDLLKIDTEGHELQVLEGMRNKISKVKGILIEFHNDEIYVSYEPKKIHSFLLSNNFKLIKKIKFPFTTWEDRFYINKKFIS